MKRLVKQHVTQGVAQGAFGIRKKKPAPMAQKPFPDNVDPDIPDIVNAWRWFQTVDADDSGELDESARRLGDMHADNAEMRFSIIAKWIPIISYGIIACVMIYYIFKGYSRIYADLL